eukprot:gnl/TRDRNA2_/TRDRNA2_194135_c0_seq1.p1 gnl/TRDRNA2_/TRDRNA2_194135_c0~~gnl/TRDRNA2_/TRDRNA2_194135_c0_seq1.p1  ORF type:complete len:406 (+),score=73.72 gnl/TRDRNA2_/TRDRNA2_194135_c0_seq1:61-1218(+)
MPPKAAASNGTEGLHIEGQAPSEVDNANYFCEYAYLYHQMDMLEDQHRTGQYFNAIMSNPKCFEGKTVLDVGAGTCMLAIMAARAGAKQVFAIEATDMAARGRRIVEANGLAGVITVIQGTLETTDLPCKVDLIVSEWMGYLLLRESMLDTVLIARDKYLKPGGSLWPSHATLYLSPISGVKALKSKHEQWKGEEQHWTTFVSDMKGWYETDFSCMREEFLKEQRQYYLQTSAFVNLTPKMQNGPGRPILEIDLHTYKLSELQEPTKPCKCSMRVVRDGAIEGFCGYFDAFFRGSTENPAEQEETLNTGPTNGTATHWGQQVFGFYPTLSAKRGDTLECTMWIRRQKRNHRLLHLEAKFVLMGPPKSEGGQPVIKEEREENYYVD